MISQPYVINLRNLTDTTFALTGGKAWNLRILVNKSFTVPSGFVITIDAYKRFLQENEINTCVELTEARGQKYILKAFPGSIIPVPYRGNIGKVAFIIQSFGNFHLDDRKGGYGSYEVLRRG